MKQPRSAPKQVTESKGQWRRSTWSILQQTLPTIIYLFATEFQFLDGFIQFHQEKHFMRKRCEDFIAYDVTRLSTRKHNMEHNQNDGKNISLRTVRFISPLLEYGYKPAVDEQIDYIETLSFAQKNTTAINLHRKPILLYLPGFDGTFLSPFLQFPELHTIFDVRCMLVDAEDRSTYDDLKNAILDYIESELGSDEGISENNLTRDATTNFTDEQQPDLINIVSNFFENFRWNRKESSTSQLTSRSDKNIENRQLYIAGESFGSILASDVALTILERNRQVRNSYSENDTTAVTVDTGAKRRFTIDLKGISLINAATCYDRSKLAVEGPKVCDMPNWLYPFGLFKLLPLFTDEYSAGQLLTILKGQYLPSIIDNEVREAYMGRVALSLPFVIPFLRRETLQWRLTEWLETGCERMASDRLQDLGTRYPNLRVLVVAGEKDRCLPSIAEAERLASILPDTIVHIVEGAGHASTCGSRVDLAALFRKRFPELIRVSGLNHGIGNFLPIRYNNRNPDESIHARTSMKTLAASGTGIAFGMEPRYDNKTVGLSPLLYWNKKFYRKLPRKTLVNF